MYVSVYQEILPRNVRVRLFHPQSRDIHDQEAFLTPSVDQKTRNYDKECSNYPLSQSP